jgi:TolB-like protein/DNA-binding winged helix-turn-helix (wHTH) protein/tetratricopeptide (TPR) repeat protein
VVAEPEPARIFRFGSFEADLGNRQLFRNGIPVSLTGQPFEVLALLLERPGQLVTREQLRARLWPSGTVVEFDHGITAALTKLREVLRDDAQRPRFIATVPRHGYRFISLVSTAAQAALEPALQAGRESATRPAPAATSDEGPSAVQRSRWSRPTALALLAAVLVLICGTAAYVYLPRAGQRAAAERSQAIRSLAVLPLENLSGDKEQEYFADGMTDALITNLAQVESLRVISRTSAMQFKGSKETLPQIGRDLKVDAIVEGTITRGENRVRVTAQLVETSSDHHLWARSYERDLKNVLALQDEIAHDITEQIRVKVTPQARSQVLQVHAVDPEAYDDYLRGRYWAYKADLWKLCRTSAECDSHTEAWKALEYYQNAIAKDPSYALGYAGVADGFIVLSISGGLPRKEAAPKVTEAAMKALALDPSLAEPHASLAFVKLFIDWDFSGAEAELKQAIALNPNFARAHMWYSYYLVAMERLDEAVKESERARDLDPFDFYVNEWLGQALYHARRYDDALRQIRHALDMFPEKEIKLYQGIVGVYEQKKMFAEAFAARQHVDTLVKCPCVAPLDEAYKRGGWRGYLLKAVQLREQSHLCGEHDYALLNDEAHAMTCLERDYEDSRSHGGVAILFIRTAPELDSIRSSPRFRDLIRRIGFPQPSSDKN